MDTTELNYVKSTEHTEMISLCYNQPKMIDYLLALLHRADSQTLEMFLIVVDIREDLVEDWEKLLPIRDKLLEEDGHSMCFLAYTKRIAFISLVEHKLNISPKTFGHG